MTSLYGPFFARIAGAAAQSRQPLPIIEYADQPSSLPFGLLSVWYYCGRTFVGFDHVFVMLRHSETLADVSELVGCGRLETTRAALEAQ